MNDQSPNKINLAEKLALFSDQWAPRIAARYNGNEVRLSKVEGEFHWHQHDDTDELLSSDLTSMEAKTVFAEVISLKTT